MYYGSCLNGMCGYTNGKLSVKPQLFTRMDLPFNRVQDAYVGYFYLKVRDALSNTWVLVNSSALQSSEAVLCGSFVEGNWINVGDQVAHRIIGQIVDVAVSKYASYILTSNYLYTCDSMNPVEYVRF